MQSTDSLESRVRQSRFQIHTRACERTSSNLLMVRPTRLCLAPGHVAAHSDARGFLNVLLMRKRRSLERNNAPLIECGGHRRTRTASLCAQRRLPLQQSIDGKRLRAPKGDWQRSHRVPRRVPCGAGRLHDEQERLGGVRNMHASRTAE